MLVWKCGPNTQTLNLPQNNAGPAASVAPPSPTPTVMMRVVVMAFLNGTGELPSYPWDRYRVIKVTGDVDPGRARAESLTSRPVLAVERKVFAETLHAIDLVVQGGIRTGVEHPRHGDDAGDAPVGGAPIVRDREGVGQRCQNGEILHR